MTRLEFPEWHQMQLPKWLRDKLEWFEYEHLPEGLIRSTSKMFHDLADELVEQLVPYSVLGGATAETRFAYDQFDIALNRLIEAKDAAVRVAVKLDRTAQQG